MSRTTSYGIVEYRAFDNMHVIQGSGVGGGSLHYFNVHIRPPKRIFNWPPWPRSINRELLDPNDDLAREMLDAKPLCPPPGRRLSPRTDAFMDACRSSGLNPELVPIAVHAGVPRLNPHGEGSSCHATSQATACWSEYFEFCRAYAREHNDKPNMLAASYSVGKDDQALLSYSSDGPAITIDPVSTGGPGWTEFLDAYNEFCIDRKGKPMLTQTPRLDGKQVTRAFGERLAQFETARRAHDPEGRLLNPYFAALLGAEKPRASRRSRQTQTDAVR